MVIANKLITVEGGTGGATGCVNIATDFGNNDDVVAEDNDFTGGTASLGLQGEGEALTNVKVRNNRRVD